MFESQETMNGVSAIQLQLFRYHSILYFATQKTFAFVNNPSRNLFA
jgi:hypothetical protein